MRIAVILCTILTLTGCTANRAMQSAFDKSIREYNRMLRWQEFDLACNTYAAEEIRSECSSRLAKSGDITIVDTRLIEKHCNPEKREGTATLQLDYYLLPSNRVKTVEYQQSWNYYEELRGTGWWIKTPPPLFQ